MRLLALLMLLPLTGWCQEILLWKAVNTTTATIVPAYTGTESPFPKVENNEDQISSTINTEAEASRLARLKALERAEQFASGKEAFRPEIGTIRVDGRLEGLAGPKVLIANQWVGAGRQLQVPLSRTAEADMALADLRRYDADAASQLESKLMTRLQQNPFLKLTISSIKTKEIQLHGDYGDYSIPIARPVDY